MASLTYSHADESSVSVLAEFNAALLAQQRVPVVPERLELENRIRGALAEGYQAVVFRRGDRPVGYCLYRLFPKYAYVRHLYLDDHVDGDLRLDDAFSLLRNNEFSDYASIRHDVPESAKEFLRTWEDMGFRPRSIRLELHTARKRKTRKSCGAVVYRRRMGKPRFLVIQHENGGHWGFPKGHVAAGESEMETATREIEEETGLRVHFREGFYERIYYLTPKERRKEVVYFLSRVRRPRVRAQAGEIRTYRWLPYWETRELLTYENTKLILDKASDYISQRGM